MAKEAIIAYYHEVQFYEAEIEDGLSALVYDINDAGDYVVITDENGGFPDNLEQEVIFAAYNEGGAFLWSVTFESSHQFREVWCDGVGGMAAVTAFRDEIDYYE